MNNFKYYLYDILLAIVIGALVGLLELFFGFILHLLTDLYASYRWFSFLLFLPLLITHLLKRPSLVTGLTSLREVSLKEDNKVNPFIIPFQMFTTWLTHLFGGSAGKEGVAIQIGGTLGNLCTRKLDARTREVATLAGMTAGFSALFQVPLAALFFVFEISRRHFTWRNFLPALFATFAAFFTIRYITIFNFNIRDITFSFNLPFTFTWQVFLYTILIGALCGILGLLFVLGLKYTKVLFAKVHYLILIFVFAPILGVLIYFAFDSRYASTGQNILNSIFYDSTATPYDFILKAIFTILTLSLLFQGGEVTPILTIGASLAFCFSFFIPIDVRLLAAISLVGFFAATTNTFLGPIFLGTEMFGYQNILLFIIVAFVANLLNFNKSIYGDTKKLI